MRKKIIGMSVIIALLAMLSIQSVAAQNITVNTWTDKPQYDPGEKGKLKISMLNELEPANAIEIYNITIVYPWHVYDAKKGEWMGNETIKGDNRILATMNSKGSENDHYYLEVEFTVPSDGRSVQFLSQDPIDIRIETSEGALFAPRDFETLYLSISGVSLPISIVALDTWMTSLIAAVVVCTIILAIVVLFATRRTQAPRALIPRATAPPPPKPKAKA